MKYKRGTIDTYDERAGYGYVIPDENTDGSQRLLVHCRSLRYPNTPLERGDRVVYREEVVPRGLLAADVYLELSTSDTESSVSPSQEGIGRILAIDTAKGHGYIEGDGQSHIYFRLEDVISDLPPNPIGVNVQFSYSPTERGYEADSIEIVAPSQAREKSRTSGVSLGTQHDLLALAIIARDGKRLDEAAHLYRRGMTESPSVQLVTSYAAMEKNRNRRTEALRIYEEGLKLYPGNLKLYADGGILAASSGNHQKALFLLEKGLALAQGSERIERTFHLALARVFVSRKTKEDLRTGLDYYQRAKKAFDRSRFGKGAFLKEDLLAMNLASVRLQHYRGNLVYEFVSRAGFRILDAHLLEQATVGADFVVEVRNPELVESYGIAGNLLIRCIFKTDLVLSDIENLEKKTSDLGAASFIDDQVSLLVVASLTEAAEKLLYRRIEDKRRTTPAIVPLTQSQIETADDPLSALRFVLDRWLYRRDLFAQNFPVSGRLFFGRHRPLTELKDAIANGISAGIFGLRKVGKTSLLKEIERRSMESGDIVVYMDLLRVPGDITDTRWIYWKLASELNIRIQRSGIKIKQWRLGGNFSDYMDIPSEFPVATAFDADLTQVLYALRNSALMPRPRVILMLDEIERVLPNNLGKDGFRGFFDFFGYLRGVAQESDDFVVIVTGANAAIAEASQFSGRDNPVFNFFREIYLPLLQPAETSVMVRTLARGMGIHFGVPACDLVHKLTGGHPFFARQFCSFLSDRFTERPLQVSITQITTAINQYLEVASKDFQEIVDRFSRDYPQELSACVAVAKAGGSIGLGLLAEKGGDNLSLKHLLGYQLVEVRDDQVSLTMDFMRLWLMRSTA